MEWRKKKRWKKKLRFQWNELQSLHSSIIFSFFIVIFLYVLALSSLFCSCSSIRIRTHPPFLVYFSTSKTFECGSICGVVSIREARAGVADRRERVRPKVNIPGSWLVKKKKKRKRAIWNERRKKNYMMEGSIEYDKRNKSVVSTNPKLLSCVSVKLKGLYTYVYKL